MYCTDCGNELPYGSNYCPYDGSYQPVYTQQPVSSSPSKYCSDCGSGNDGTLYCLLCGSFLQTIIPFKKERVNEKASAKTLELPQVKSTTLKTALLYGLFAFLLVGAFSFMFSQLYEATALDYEAMLEDMVGVSPLATVEEIYADAGETNSFVMDPLIGFTDYWMAFHMLNSDFSFSASGGYEGDVLETFNGGVLLNSGSLLLLLIPFVSLIVAGFLYGRRNESTVSQLWLFSLIVGGCYGVLTAILSVFSGFSFDGTVQDEWMKATISIQNDYPFFRALFAGILIGTIGTFIGSLIGSNKLRKINSSPLIEGVRAISIGVFICTIAMMIFIYSAEGNSLFATEGMLIRNLLLIAVQGGFILWNLLNFSQFSLDFSGLGESGALTYSVLSGMKIEGTEIADFASFLLTSSGQFSSPYMVAGLLLPILLFVWIGYRIQGEGEVHLHKIALFGLLYAFLMAVLTSATNSGIEVYGIGMTELLMLDTVQELPKISLGFSTIGTFFKCFILSTVFAIGGAYLKKYRSN